MMIELATHFGLWLLFGISVGVVMTTIILLLSLFWDYETKKKRFQAELKAAEKKGFDLARDWNIGEATYLEEEIDLIWYEIEELQAQIERLKTPKYSNGR